MDAIGRLDKIASYRNVFSALWYTSLPCFDLVLISQNVMVQQNAALVFKNFLSTIKRFCVLLRPE